MIVHKFGGTSLGNAERFGHVADLVTSSPDPLRLVVVSAMSGTTNALINAARDAAAGSAETPYRPATARRQAPDLEQLLPPGGRGISPARSTPAGRHGPLFYVAAGRARRAGTMRSIGELEPPAGACSSAWQPPEQVSATSSSSPTTWRARPTWRPRAAGAQSPGALARAGRHPDRPWCDAERTILGPGWRDIAPRC